MMWLKEHIAAIDWSNREDLKNEVETYLSGDQRRVLERLARGGLFGLTEETLLSCGFRVEMVADLARDGLVTLTASNRIQISPAGRRALLHRLTLAPRYRSALGVRGFVRRPAAFPST
jgi:hypothetical protein